MRPRRYSSIGLAPAMQPTYAIRSSPRSGGNSRLRAMSLTARSAGRRSGDAVSHLVARFNAEGLTALTPRHGGGRSREYDHAARERVLREVRREPTPEADGTATWSLSTLRKSLRSAPDGL